MTIARAAEGNYQVFVQGADNLFIADVRQGDKSILNIATAGADGRYEIRGVRPGEYKVFAGRASALPARGVTPELLSRIESRGISVNVKAAASARIDIEAITN